MLGKIVVHGGAGIWRKDVRRGLLGVSRAAAAGSRILARSGSALDAVEAAVIIMEDDPVFNAGKGSSLTFTGTVEMDAAIMDGRDLSAGAVALLHTVKNPIRLARLVMEKTDHVLLAGENAERLARSFSLPRTNPITAERRRRYLMFKKGRVDARIGWIQKNRALIDEHPEILGGDTVGAVAVDVEGNFAAASSTGGVMLKLPGRIGDTPQIGCGLYSDNSSGAATVTGVGEVAIRLTMSKEVCLLMEHGRPAAEAAAIAVRKASNRLKGSAGVIAIDCKGRVAIVHNSPFMPWSLSTTGTRKPKSGPRGRILAALGS
jgi:beta-aspartyl-peptidase (threonine type)